MTDDHAIFIGGKPFMNYVTAVVMQFTTKGADQVVVRSRGKFISRAVDVAEVVKSRFLKDQIEVSNISMDSEEFKNREGRTVRVSTLDIALNRIAKSALSSQPIAEKKEPEEAEQEVAETAEEPAKESNEETPETTEESTKEQSSSEPEAESEEETETPAETEE